MRATKRWTAAGATAILLVAGGATGTAQAAPASPVRCGDTLTVDTRLTRDLTCPDGNGLVLLPGVTLDLGGSTLRGPGGFGAAVDLSPSGYSALVNGTVEAWGTGTGNVTAEAAEAHVTGVRFVSAPLASWGGDLTVTRSQLVDSPVWQLGGSITIEDSRLERSDVQGTAARVVLDRSTVRSGGISGETGHGVRISSSTLDGRGYDGSVAGCDGSDISISDSTVRNYSEPIRGLGCSVSLAGSTFTDNPGGVLSGAGLEDGPGSANVSGSSFRRSGVVLRGAGMGVYDSTFVDNVTGVVADRPESVTVVGNTFTRNRASGVVANGDGLTVGDNSATRNGEYGINAPSANDLGGNRAYRNRLGNCVGLTC